MRLIDAMRIDFDEVDISGCTDVDDIIAAVEDLIDKQPTVDAAPVVHGRWDDECRCTVCGWYGEDRYKRDVYDFDYCPNCGARMDGDGNA